MTHYVFCFGDTFSPLLIDSKCVCVNEEVKCVTSTALGGTNRIYVSFFLKVCTKNGPSLPLVGVFINQCI